MVITVTQQHQSHDSRHCCI